VDHADFLNAIIAAPDDDTPRLVYADWLEERGDQRGEFIRVQCELARLPDEDPRRVEMQSRERVLLEEHEEQWVSSLKGLVSNWRFHRGFVDEGTVEVETFLSNGNLIFQNTPLRSVKFAEKALPALPLANCPHLSRLSGLHFSFTDMNVEDLRTIISSPYLGQLRILDLTGSEFGAEGVRLLMQSPLLKQLSELGLCANGLGEDAARLLAASPSIAGLTHLSLSNNNISVDGIEALALSPYVNRLTDLSLGFCWAGAGYGRALGCSAQLHNLRRLFLSESGLGDAGVSALASSPYLKGLTELWLDDNDIGATGFSAVLDGLPALETLVIYGNSIGDEGLQSIPENRLLHLDLAGCQLTDLGVRYLVESPQLAGLTGLLLSRNAIGDRGAQALAHSPHLTNIRILSLIRTAITNSGRQMLTDRFGDRVIFELPNESDAGEAAPATA